MRRAGQLLGDGVADLGETRAHLIALLGDALGCRRARGFERNGDLFGRGAERGGDVVAGLVEALGQLIADRLDVARQTFVRAAERRAHLLAIGDDRLALIGEFGDQSADAPLALARRAIERGHFGAQQRFEFAGALIGFFDAVPQRRNLAADRLREADELLVRGRFRLGQAHRHLGDRIGRLAQVLQAARERGEAEKQ